MPCLCPLPLHPHPLPRINDCLSSFAPNHDQDGEAIENVYSNCENPPCSTKWSVFTLMGLLITATLFMCVLNWRWAQCCYIGGGPTLLGAAKPYGEFIHCIPFLSVQQIGNRITLLWGSSAVLTAKYITFTRWNKINIKTLHIAFALCSLGLSTYMNESCHLVSLYTLSYFISKAHFNLMLMFMFMLIYYFCFNLPTPGESLIQGSNHNRPEKFLGCGIYAQNIVCPSHLTHPFFCLSSIHAYDLALM